MSDIVWIVDTTMLEGQIYKGYKYFPDAVRDAGFKCLETKYKPFSQSNDDLQEAASLMRPAICYGTHNFIKQGRNVNIYPGDYCDEDNLKCSQWMTRYPLDWMLNKDASWMPWGFFRNHIGDMQPVFIRPDGVGKLFPGQVIDTHTPGYIKDVDNIDNCSGVLNHSMILVNKIINLLAEYRFFVVAGKVVAGRQYRRGARLDIREDYSDGAHALAVNVAEFYWQPDSCYVVDIAETECGYKIVELNSMSCAGTYASDISKIVIAVSEQATKDWEDLQS